MSIIKAGKFNHIFTDLRPTAMSSKRFNYGFYFSLIFMSGTWAYYKTDRSYMSNEWYTRPDLKPFKAMVKLTPEEEAVQQHLRNTVSLSGGYEFRQQERKKSAFYRLLFPYTADYNLKSNPVADLAVAQATPGRYDVSRKAFADHHYDM